MMLPRGTCLHSYRSGSSVPYLIDTVRHPSRVHAMPPHGAAAAALQLLSRLAPIPCRDDLAIAAERHFHKLGRAAEVGVLTGYFAAHNLQHWTGEYYMIDAWETGSNTVNPHNPARPSSRGTFDRAHYEAAERRTAFARNRTHMKRGYSVPTALLFEDEYFDWLYIDALHTREAVLDDLRAWWPKLRSGGLISGDDCEKQNRSTGPIRPPCFYLRALPLTID